MTAPFIIDAHTHLGRTAGFQMYYRTVEDFVRLMDRTATQISIFACQPLLDRQFEMGYTQAVQALEQYPHRLKAYTVFDPNWPEVSLQWMKKFQFHPGFVGIKIHPAVHAVAPEDARYEPLWAFAEKHRLVVLTHSWSPDPQKPVQNLSTPDHFAHVLDAYPQVRLILGHAGGRDVGIQQAIQLMNQHKNCWADISGDNFTLGHLEWMVEKVGPDRILYGTDSNWIEPRYQLGHVLKARLSAEVRYKILRQNAVDLFGDKLGILTAESARKH